MSIITKFMLFCIVLSGCTYKETRLIEPSSAITIPTSCLDSLVSSQKPVRISYYGKSGALKQNVRGFLVQKKDSSYLFQPKKIGETVLLDVVDIEVKNIKDLSVIENDGLQPLDFLPVLLVGGTLVTAFILLLAGVIRPS